MTLTCQPIGLIHSPYTDRKGMPIQPAGALGIRGHVDVLPDYREGLADLEGFSHLLLLYHFHRSEGYALTVTAFMDDTPRGLFATRAPKRPNPIGLSVVRLLDVREGRLDIDNVDVLDGTPLLDIKPYVPDFDAVEDVRTGWLENHPGRVRKRRSDERFL